MQKRTLLASEPRCLLRGIQKGVYAIFNRLYNLIAAPAHSAEGGTYGTVAQRAESLHRRTQRSPVRVRPVPLTYASVRGGSLSSFPPPTGLTALRMHQPGNGQ